nr:hypothetical protein [Tanacetum cinerariifolium]
MIRTVSSQEVRDAIFSMGNDKSPGTDGGPPRCAFKVDIQKAYDTVNWGVLHEVIGFWVSSSYNWSDYEVCYIYLFSIIINGTLHGYFKGKRGLPLDNFTYHHNCSNLNIINLCFVDGLFLFAHADVNSARVIMEALNEFKNAMGLVPSLRKSSAYFCNILNYTKLDILNVLPFEEGKLRIKYLGVPLVSSRLIYRDCKELAEKVKNMIND